MNRVMICVLAAILVSSPVLAKKPPKPINFDLTASMASHIAMTLNPDLSPPTDALIVQTGEITHRQLGRITIDHRLRVASSLQVIGPSLGGPDPLTYLGCSADDDIYIPFLGTLTLIDVDTQSALLFYQGAPDAIVGFGICIDEIPGPRSSGLIGGSYDLRGGTGDFALYNSGFIDVDTISLLAPPYPVTVDLAGYISEMNFNGSISSVP